MKSNISCVKSRALLQFVEARNPEQLPMLWRYCEKEAGKEAPERFFLNPDNKMSVDLCTLLMDLARKATCDEMAAFKAAYRFGRSAHREQKPGFFSSPFGLMKDLLREAQKSDRLPGKKIEFVTVSETHVIVRVHWPKELNLTRDFCLFEQGLYQALPLEHGLPPARLWERTCFFEGGPYCEYEIWWSRTETTKKPSLKLFFSRKERSEERPEKFIHWATAAATGATAEDPGAGGSAPVPVATAVPCDNLNIPVESESLGAHALSTTASETAAPVALETRAPSDTRDTTTEIEPEQATAAREETTAHVFQSAGNEELKSMEAGDGRRLPGEPSMPLPTPNEQMLFLSESIAPGGEEKQQPEGKMSEETPTVKAKNGFDDVEEVSMQLGHLFEGLSRMVALMLSEKNTGNPQVEHLKRMEDMLWKGDALRRRLLPFSQTKDPQVTACEEPSEPPPEQPDADEKARATILLVEDLETIRAAGKDMLCALGCHVLVATDRHQAMEIFRERSDRIDLVIMDMNMSMAAVKEMKDIKPAVKIFFTNTELTEETQRTVRTLGCEGLIQTPFSANDLQRNLQGILSREQV